jgi:hypothetical protein
MSARSPESPSPLEGEGRGGGSMQRVANRDEHPVDILQHVGTERAGTERRHRGMLHFAVMGATPHPNPPPQGGRES